jgi:hemerythrin
MPIMWTEHLSVKSDVIDEDHQYLIRIVNEIEQIISTRSHADLFEAVDSLIEFTELHFAREEEISLFAGCHLHHSHIPQINHINTRKQMLMEIGDDWSKDAVDSFVIFLMDWLAVHIIIEDMQMKPAFEKLPLDFNPMQLLPLKDSKISSPLKALARKNNEVVMSSEDRMSDSINLAPTFA